MANAISFPPTSVARVPYPTTMPAAPGTDKTKKVSQDFEGVFLANMFEGLDDDGPFGAGADDGPWRSLLTEQYAKTIAASGGIGVANQIQHQLMSL
jgi:peptidoglycan hydrolase FlgJ